LATTALALVVENYVAWKSLQPENLIRLIGDDVSTPFTFMANVFPQSPSGICPVLSGRREDSGRHDHSIEPAVGKHRLLETSSKRWPGQ
jgi:hypothetical protein